MATSEDWQCIVPSKLSMNAENPIRLLLDSTSTIETPKDKELIALVAGDPAKYNLAQPLSVKKALQNVSLTSNDGENIHKYCSHIFGALSTRKAILSSQYIDNIPNIDINDICVTCG
eukprot:409549_1